MKFDTLQELELWTPPPVVQYIGGDILHAGTKLLVFAAPKRHKSILAKQIALCLATGSNFLGFGTTPAKVAILQSEIPKHLFRERIMKMKNNVGFIPPKSLFLRTDRQFKLVDQKHVTGLSNFLKQTKVNVLILDPWYKMLRTGENKEYERTMDIMDALIDAHGLSLIMIHHDTVPQLDKDGKEIPFFHPRGPRTLEGWFDSLIQVTGERESTERTLSFELRHARSITRPIELQFDESRAWFSMKP